jgi:hypothetical protein
LAKSGLPFKFGILSIPTGIGAISPLAFCIALLLDKLLLLFNPIP